MSRDWEEQASGGSGPWMLKATGRWGAGRHSINDFEVYVVDLSMPADNDPPVPSAQITTQAFIASIDEDVDPEPGMDVRLGNYVIDYTFDGWELSRVDDGS